MKLNKDAMRREREIIAGRKSPEIHAYQSGTGSNRVKAIGDLGLPTGQTFATPPVTSHPKGRSDRNNGERHKGHKLNRSVATGTPYFNRQVDDTNTHVTAPRSVRKGRSSDVRLHLPKNAHVAASESANLPYRYVSK